MAEKKYSNHPFYLIVSVNIDDLEEYGKYRAGAAPCVAKLDVFEILGNEKNMILYEGTYGPNHFVLNRFENREIFENYLFSPEYQEAKKHRLAGATTYYILGFESREESVPAREPGKVPFYNITSVDITDPEEYAKYRASNQPMFDKMGDNFQILATEDEMIVYEGEYPVNHIALTRFDCRETFENFYNSPEYKAGKEHRLAGSVTNFSMGFEEIDPALQVIPVPSE